MPRYYRVRRQVKRVRHQLKQMKLYRAPPSTFRMLTMDYLEFYEPQTASASGTCRTMLTIRANDCYDPDTRLGGPEMRGWSNLHGYYGALRVVTSLLEVDGEYWSSKKTGWDNAYSEASQCPWIFGISIVDTPGDDAMDIMNAMNGLNSCWVKARGGRSGDIANTGEDGIRTRTWKLKKWYNAKQFNGRDLAADEGRWSIGANSPVVTDAFKVWEYQYGPMKWPGPEPIDYGIWRIHWRLTCWVEGKDVLNNPVVL